MEENVVKKLENLALMRRVIARVVVVVVVVVV